MVLPLVPVAAAPGTPTGGAGAAGVASPQPVADPLPYVDPFVGTGSGGKTVGQVDTFPGPSLPFGMVQWSPDTTSRPDGGGYNISDAATTGFSLTHLSGPGCPVFGDVPFLPVAGSVPANPSAASEALSHRGEQARAGSYAVNVGGPAPVHVELSTTTRTGLGTFTFPSSAPATMLINASGSANIAGNSSLGTVEVRSPQEVVGSTANGVFCVARNTYKLYFAAQFTRPAVSSGTWSGPAVSGAQACSGPACGAHLTFAPSSSPLEVRVGVSYVSVAGALANLRAEDPGWDLAGVEQRASDAWRALLGRVHIAGGTTAQLTSFYTALYHAFLDPTTFSDADGRYPTFTDTAMVATGVSRTRRVQYANFSMWDTYRDQMELVALLDPTQASDMVTSVLNDAAQGGWLPRWPVANSYTATQSGDSADPLIAGAYAFGARGFDTKRALAAMVHGADDPAPASRAEDVMFESDSLVRYEERPGLPDYEARHYVPNLMFRQSSGVPDGASTTLEYASDDAAIGLFAQSVRRPDVAARFLARAQNWEYVLNAATGYAAARGATGRFPPGAPVPPPPPDVPPYPLDQIYFGQNGFQEGNAAQYTWMVPFNVAALANALGGRQATNARLDTFFGQLQAGPDAPQYWAGNEPDIEAPWLYDFTGQPWKTQALVHQIVQTLYAPTPGGEPGNDDLGTMASWYVWAALGMYPEIPGAPLVVLGSPLFPRLQISVPGEGSLDIEAPATSDSTPYVQAVHLNGKPISTSWLRVGTLMPGASGGSPTATVLSFDLGTAPNASWASAPQDAPPSYGAGEPPAIGFSSPWGQLVAPPGTPTRLDVGAQSVTDVPQTVRWRALAPPGVIVSPAAGLLHLGGDSPDRATQVASVDAIAGGACQEVALRFWSEDGRELPGVVVALSPHAALPCGAPSELGGTGPALATTVAPVVKLLGGK